MEINLLHGDALDLADQAFLFKRTAREAALRHKMYATFMAKPHGKRAGQRHAHPPEHRRRARRGKNIFSDADGTPTPLFFSHIAGLQKYLPAAMSLFAPNVNSYRRITRFHSAPINVQWGYDNRTAGLRVPVSDAARRAASRTASPAPTRIPYLAIAASLACGYLGMVEGLKPTEPIAGSAYDLPFCAAAQRSTRRSALLRECEPLVDIARRPVRCGLHGQGKRVRDVPAGDQLLGARAPAAERLRAGDTMSAKPRITERATRDWQELDAAPLPASVHRLQARSRPRARASSRAPRASTSTTPTASKILDAMSGLWCVNVGYGRKELADAAREADARAAVLQQLLPEHHAAGDRACAKLLDEVTPPQFNHVFFTGRAREANDTIMRMVRRYWDLLGQPKRNVIISRMNAYHGSTMAGASLGGMKAMHEQGGLPIPGIVHIDQPYWYGEGGDLSPEEFGLRAARARSRRRSRSSARSASPPSSASRCRAPAA